MKVNDTKNTGAGDLEDWMRGWRARIDMELNDKLPPPGTRPAVVHEAMRYACLNGGKRLRAMLTLLFCEAVGGTPDKALSSALALEIFHASTLVHDDLPCMDDDDLRRGKPSTHICYGEANALLAGNALLTLAFDWLASTPVPPPHSPGRLVAELARSGGSQGVIGGQIEDLMAEKSPADEDQLRYIHTEKTARLIACACRMGAMCGGARAAKVEKAGAYGLNLGLAFQILDDILDATQSTEILGKPAKSDEERGKLTSVSIWGLDRSRKEAKRHTGLALEVLDRIEGDTARLRDLTRWMLERSM